MEDMTNNKRIELLAIIASGLLAGKPNLYISEEIGLDVYKVEGEGEKYNVTRDAIDLLADLEKAVVKYGKGSVKENV